MRPSRRCGGPVRRSPRRRSPPAAGWPRSSRRRRLGAAATAVARASSSLPLTHRPPRTSPPGRGMPRGRRTGSASARRGMPAAWRRSRSRSPAPVAPRWSSIGSVVRARSGWRGRRRPRSTSCARPYNRRRRPTPECRPSMSPATRRTLLLSLPLAGLVAMIAWPSFVARIQYARTRAEIAAIRDAALGAELAPVGKLFTTLARVIGPAVVNVTAKRRVVTLADEIAALAGASPRGANDESFGSGVVIASDGTIVTNYHVVAHSEQIEVALADGRRFEADLVGADAATDIAVLKIETDGLAKAEWGDSDSVQVGEMVWAIGNPFGLDRTLTYGIVSAVGRRGVLEDPLQEFLQTDAAINPGNSGGPLVDVHGRIMGITTAIVGKDYSGIGFAIPSNAARRVSEQILRTGHVERGYLGMALQDRPSAPGGSRAVVAAVEPRSPAALAGIAAGDVITAFDGEPIRDSAQLVLLLTRATIGVEVPLDIVRGDAAFQMSVRVGRRPREP
ncbi:MAG: PDZ domain-containing protein [Planctomycetia bacterium]|nr:PDZ domain-containing protein [Planctomycetia bacterium]